MNSEQCLLPRPTTNDERPSPRAHANRDSPIQNFTQARKTWDHRKCISFGCPPPKLPFGEYYASLVESPAADLGHCRPDRLCPHSVVAPPYGDNSLVESPLTAF